MKKILSTLHVQKEELDRNLAQTGDLVLAEAAYILLSVSGDPDGHERIRKITLTCEKEGTRLAEELKKDAAAWQGLNDQLGRTVGLTAEEFFANPGLYRGIAAEKTVTLSDRYEKIMKEIKEEL